jgi:hypothetical protein
MDSQKQSTIDRLKQANNVLVTVNSNPSVDQLAACIGLTIILNELGKHGTAVFSGTVPSTLEFLEPEKTIEKNTDSLRDFIISLDKSKADKLRYKVEDKVVKIFITPYRTSISEKDLDFSQGDFNVDVVVALGVHDQKELDQAITSHGRILHDATIISINTSQGNEVGTINWQDPKASSLSEMVASMVDSFEKKVLDNQVATALLTGIVAETNRFSNDKTSPDTMKISAQLMAAGANQQLVANKLDEPPPSPPDKPVNSSPKNPPPPPNDGTLEISHDGKTGDVVQNSESELNDEELLKLTLNDRPQIKIDEQGQIINEKKQELLTGPGPTDEADDGLDSDGVMDDEDRPSGEANRSPGFGSMPASGGGQSTDDLQAKSDNNTTDPHSTPELGSSLPPVPVPNLPAPPGSPLPPVPMPPQPSSTAIPDFTLPEPEGGAPAPDANPSPTLIPPEPPKLKVNKDETLAEIEAATKSSHLAKQGGDAARDRIKDALLEAPPQSPEPIIALNAQPLSDNLHDEDKQQNTPAGSKLAEPLVTEDEPINKDKPAAAKPMDMPLPPPLTSSPASSASSDTTDDNTGQGLPPPPVPPPMMPINPLPPQ